MQLNRIKAVRGYKAPRRIAGSPSVVAPKRVQRECTVVRANQVRLDLAVVIDLFARNLVGLSMNPTISRELALDALMMPVWRRKPDGEVSYIAIRAASTAVMTGSASAGPITCRRA